MKLNFNKIDWRIIMGVVIICGLIYFAFSYNRPESIIKTGKIKIDGQEMVNIQKAIDDGHQPWRADPKEIACIDSIQYGFNLEENYKTIKEIYHPTNIPGIIKYQVTHAEKDYIITVIQPVPGKDKIWTISEISEK